jgi:hypothetical protein
MHIVGPPRHTERMTVEQQTDRRIRDRPLLSLRLIGGGQDDGEIRLDDLTRIAEATQTVVRRIARGMVGQRRPGRAPEPVTQATALSLVGLHKGSTVLEIAGPPMVDEQTAFEFDLPTDLGELSLRMLSEGVCALASDDIVPELPVGFDSSLVDDLDDWLRSLRKFESVDIESKIDGKKLNVEVQPQVARKRLRKAAPQPILPFVSPTEQVLEGKLYALNLNTGTFSIEDDAGHKIRVRVPEDLRREAATLVDHRVRAVGKPELDEMHRLRSFDVAYLELAADVAALSEQTGFFEPHDLKPPAEGDLRDLDGWAIDGLTDEESEGFAGALVELR